ncbi:unnamed protein product [Ilex paraguariensis]|uniref:FAR1 domain-containing protein n=1 Tax=Ilex paraguariensis TaxID=185542 RepID=A0ABC8T2K4_9AQUA
MATDSGRVDMVLCDDYTEEGSILAPNLDAINSLHLSEIEMNNQSINTSSCNGPLKPCKGMIFAKLDDAMTCYKAYETKKGFSIQKNHTGPSHSNKPLIGVVFSCNREGRHRPSNQKKHKNVVSCYVTMIGCKAMMGLKKDEEKCVVYKFGAYHNHEICPLKITLVLRG